MAVKLTSLAADVDLETKGDWQDCPTIPGVRLNVRSINYPAYTIARDQLIQRLRRQAGGKPIPQDKTIVEIGRLYAQHLLLGWEGFDEPYTPARALEILTDASYREVITAVESAAGGVGQAQIEFIDDAIKN